MSALSTPDLDGAKAFYGAVFGWETDTFAAGDLEVTLWRLPGFVGGEPEQPVPADVIATSLRTDGPPQWDVDFWVDDVDATAARAAELGGTVVAGPFDLPIGRRAVLADPQGAHVLDQPGGARMSTIEVVNHVTLDGVMQAPADPDEDRRGGFEHGGWAAPYSDEVQGEYMGARMSSGGGRLLLGRWTYEKFEDAWQKQPEDNPIRRVLEASTKYVVSRSPRELGWQNSVLLEGDAAETVAELKAREDGNIVILGERRAGPGAAPPRPDRRVLLLTIHPLVLGSGRRLLAGDGAFARFKLVESKPTTTGVLIARYEAVWTPPEMSTRACRCLWRGFSAGAGEQERLLAAQRLARSLVDLDLDELTRRRQPGEVDDLVVARAPAQARGVGARGALDEHLERAADEALRALAGAPLDDLDEPLHALDAHLVRQELVGEARRPRCRAAASR